MMNDMDRFHLVIDVIDNVPVAALVGGAAAAGDGRRAGRGQALHPRLYGDDIPSVRDWTWTGSHRYPATGPDAGALSDTSADFSPADSVPRN